MTRGTRTPKEDECGDLPIFLEEVFCRYECVGKVIADPEELDLDEVKEFFVKFGVRLTLTTTYNPEANGNGDIV